MEMTLVPVARGWAALADGWATIAPSKEEAVQKYREAELKHAEIMARAVIEKEGEIAALTSSSQATD